ncbi:glycosyltransferase [Myxacorys almedinensis A]|uniref:Glycosyltransferase n=2 Tax=Myxacorys TaxID=2056239 RepID=A0A8J8CJ83_9CYAN|nr:glycosyltransferase family 4 protein [Myxacorys almedinensis]NDJ18738.1 glycosyltransferase [Myxacorys almedinensis A]
MRVLHINQSDHFGGAAIAGHNLHQGLLKRGVESHLLVGRAETPNERVAQIAKASQNEKRLSLLTQRLGFNHIHLLSTAQLKYHSFYRSADLLNFHNLHTGYFNYLAIAELVQTKPAVVTMHDMWWLTGHCAFSYGCDRWKIGCGNCPDLSIFPPVRRDSTHWEWKLKDWVYDRAKLTFIAPSRWLVDLTNQRFLNRFPVYYIPNGIDIETYQPIEMAKCRDHLNIPQHKKVLLFVAHNLQERRKGGDLVLAALQRLPASLKAEIVMLTLGEGDPTLAEKVGIQAMNLGYVRDDALKAIAYSASDLLVFPTRADNLPLVLQESLACGTPMVSCDVGGVSDLIRPGITGYLAKSEDIDDLSNGIKTLLDDEALRQKMRESCRAIALEEYSLHLQAQRYADLYHQILQN